MKYIKLDDSLYKLPMADLYIDRFSSYLIDDILLFDHLDDKSLYNNMKLLFDFVANSLCVMDEEDYPEHLLVEKRNIRSRMSSIDNLQNHFARANDYNKSVNIIKKFMIEMLEHYDKLMSADEVIERKV